MNPYRKEKRRQEQHNLGNQNVDGQVIANLVVLKKLNLRVIAQKAKKVQSLYPRSLKGFIGC